MSRPAAQGLFVPVTTPFRRSDGEVDRDALRRNVEALLSSGVQGIVVNGSTGEAALLTPEEQCATVEAAREAVPRDRWLVAGTGAESTRATVAATRTAARAGADAAMVRPPAYYGGSLSTDALAAHFRAVADASPIPVFLYNIPKYTHLAIAAETVATLAHHPQVVGLKDSGGDLERFTAYRAAAPAWRLFVGSLAHVLAAIELGAVGGVLAAGCFLPGPVGRLLAASAARDRAAAGPLQEQLAPVGREIVGQLGVPGVKCAMDLVGLVGGPPRPPLQALDEPGRRRVIEMLAAAPR